MGDVVDLADARAARSTPSTGLIARPTTRDQQDLSSKFSEFTPARLGAIIRKTERGEIQDWADLCDRMVADATVKASYESRLAAVGASRWIVEPGEPTGDPERDRFAEDARAFVEVCLRSIASVDPPLDYRDVGGFDQAIGNLLDGIGKGLSVCEIDWRYVAGDWLPARLLWVHSRRFRFSRAWEPMLVDTGDELHPFGLPLEPGKFIVHMPRPIAGYPTMTGAMRTIAWPFLFKRWCQQFWLQGAERFAWPFIWAKVPRDAGPEVRAKAQTGLDKLSADHSAVVEDPVAFQLLESTMKDGGTWKEFHAAMNSEIAKGLQGMADAAEATKIGAYGAVEARKGISVDPRIALDERGIAGTTRQHLTYWMLWFNRHRWSGVMPPVPHVRWAIAGKRREIPKDAYSLVTRNQVLESLDLPMVAGPDGEQRADGGISDAQFGQVLEIVATIESGDRTPEYGAILIATAAPGLAPERVAELARAAAAKAKAAAIAPAPTPGEPAPEVEASKDVEPEVGAIWTDTDDDHRLEITRVDASKVYFRDLDAPNPNRQWSWARRSFLERCSPPAVQEPAA